MFEGIEDRHQSIQSLAQFFTYEHLPPHLKPVSHKCAELADFMLGSSLPDSPELTAGLRKLLEAKDCFVRAALTKDDVGKFSWTDR